MVKGTSEQAGGTCPKEVLARKTLDRIGDVLREKGLSLEELIEAGREERAKIVHDMYGIRDTAGPLDREQGCE